MPDKKNIKLDELIKRAISQPLVTDKFTADPSAHLFNGKIYIYPSHDIDAGIPFNDNGDHFGMRDYHVYMMNSPDDHKAEDLGKILDIDDVPWAKRQMWAPDIAENAGKYFFYFPAKDDDDIFRIGVATADSPSGPFTAEKKYIDGSYSIDPAIFRDNGNYYMYFGGIWGGQLQNYRDNIYSKDYKLPEDNEPALGPIVAKMSGDMKSFSSVPKEIIILDQDGNPLVSGDNERRYFEGPWMHTYNDKYYLSYSTGDTHYICYAIGDDPTGPFKYAGRILEPVIGWTTHHSILEFDGRWFLFYHDSSLSEGVTHLRCMKVVEIFYDEHGKIITVSPYSSSIQK